MSLHDFDALQDFRDSQEVWLHWGDVTVELMRDTLEAILKEMKRLQRFEDLMMSLEEFEGTDIEDFIIFATD